MRSPIVTGLPIQSSDAGAGGTDLDAVQQLLDIGDLGGLLIHAPFEDGQAGLRPRVEQGLLAGLAVLGLRHLQRLAGDLQPVLQLGPVEHQEQLAFAHRLVGLHLEPVDHAVDGRAQDGRFTGDHLSRSQGRLRDRKREHHRATGQQRRQKHVPAARPY
ncbi:hypothetical protein ABNQ39_27205 [Azospirillum sp. A26]